MISKKLIALAVGTSMAAPMAAQAEITTYAHIQFELANIDNGTDADMFITDRERGRIGMKGSNDLGDGMKAFAVAEFDIVGGNDDSEFGDAEDTTGVPSAGALHTHDVKVRGNAFRIREVMAGLQGGFGTVEIGTLKSAYKYTGGIKYDPFVTTTLEARGNYGMSGGNIGHNSFINNAIAYKNKVGAVDFWLTYSPDATDTDDDAIGDDGQMTYAIKYNDSNFEVFLSGVDQGTSLTDYSSNKLGGKYKFGGNMAIMGQYEMNDVNGTDRTYIFLGFQLKSGKQRYVFQYGVRDTDDGVKNNADGTYVTLGAIHHFNKSTRLFSGYKSRDGGGTLEDSVLTVGLRVDI